VRVLYVSKASCVAAHRGKLAVLGRQVELTLLSPRRWGSTVYEPAPDGNEPFETILQPTPLSGHNHLHFYRHLGRVLVRGAFDLVHVDEEPYSVVTAQVVQRARAVGVPSLFFAWQNIDKRLPPPFTNLRAGVFATVAGGIAGNDEAADVLYRRGFRKPLAVIPQMGVDPDVFRPDPTARSDVRAQMGLGEAHFLVGYMGRLVEEKGVDVLLAALARVPEAQGLLIGGGPERQRLQARAAALGLSDRVRFVGSVPSLQAPRWIAALDCLVLPSRTTPRWKEQFGRVLAEAMSCGVAVVGSSSGEIPRVIGNAGTMVEEGDADALTRALRTLAHDPARRSELGVRGRARVLAHFTQEKVVSDTLGFYRALLGVRAPELPTFARGPA
jgi:glycosyltransferase involved in cell wall biosynthesis